MHLVLLSGGSGQRLWPLSNGVRAKVFLKLLQAPGGGHESMLQRVVRQLEAAGLLRDAVIVTHEAQQELTLNQIGGRLPILGEPHRRGTFAAAALAALHLSERRGAKPEDIVTVMPADVYAEASFFDSVRKLPDALVKSGAELALIGTTPSGPSREFGYIVPAGPDGAQDCLRIERFVEKPNESDAAVLIAGGALWNCGVYAFRLGYLLEQLRARGLPGTGRELQARLEGMPELSFDRELAERSAHSVVVACEGPWYDLGSWETLSDRLGGRIVGPGSLTGDCGDTRLINQLPVPVHVVDGHNLIVAASADGILVAARNSSSRIKETLGQQSPIGGVRVEEKRWGTRIVLDVDRGPGCPGTRTSRVSLAAGAHTSYHAHPDRSEVLAVLNGDGEAIVDGNKRGIRAGDVLQLDAGCGHGLRARTPLVCVEIHSGTIAPDDGRIRLAMDW